MRGRIARAWDGSVLRGTDQGGHITHWRSADGRERLYLSGKSEFTPGVALRGGVPIIFPQFAAQGPLPRHGFARTIEWQPVTAGSSRSGAAELVWRLQSNRRTRQHWPHEFDLELQAVARELKLSLRLTVRNTGDSAFAFQTALHTYLQVEDVTQVELRGLVGCRYRDNAQGGRESVALSGPLRIAGEIDRIYGDTPSPLVLTEGEKRLGIYASGFQDTVVWNPGPELARALSDLPDSDWRRLLCVEAGVILQPLTLAPGESWIGTQTLEVL